MKLSIIVPVYNVAPWVRHCMQSLTEQGLDDYEVLLVNDASRDNSRGICSEWCEDHPQFRLLNHDRNRGLSEARNTGLREAQGEIVTFVDSDDFLEPLTLSKVLAEMDEETDVVEYPVMQHHLSKTPHLQTFQRQSVPFGTWMQQGGHNHCYAWNKLYRKDLWDGIVFPAGKHFEDMMTIPHVLRKARAIRQTDTGLYYYCQRQGSICTTASEATLLDYNEACNILLQMPENRANHDLYLRARNSQITFRRLTGKTPPPLLHHSMPLAFAFSKGLTLHDRLKALYFALFS